MWKKRLKLLKETTYGISPTDEQLFNQSTLGELSPQVELPKNVLAFCLWVNGFGSHYLFPHKVQILLDMHHLCAPSAVR